MTVAKNPKTHSPPAASRRLLQIFCLVLLFSVGGGCGDDLVASLDTGEDVAELVDATDGTDLDEIGGPVVSMDFTRSDGFYSAPFPDESLRNADESINLSQFPNPDNIPFVNDILQIIGRDAYGFSSSSGIFFRLDDTVASESLPSLDQSVADQASVFLVSVDARAPDYLNRYPIAVVFEPDGGPFGDLNLLSLVPVQGIPLREGTLYAAVLTTAVTGADGLALSVAEGTRQILLGEQPSGMSDAAWAEYQSAVVALQSTASLDEIAALAVFRTGQSTLRLTDVLAHSLAQGVPEVDAAFSLDHMADSYCIYASTVAMPVYQNGAPPFSTGGGNWTFADDGSPLRQAYETSRVFVTLPRSEMPDDGFPVVAFIRAGGGGDRPLIDRGYRPVAGGSPEDPYGGPAVNFAAEGFAGIQADGPHGGPRNVSFGDEQFLMFNVANPNAMRDNVRQTALETAILAHMLENISIDASECSGLTTSADGPAFFDTSLVGLMGHSMGGWVAPLVLAVEPIFGFAILSGAGGSWIANVMDKERPLEVQPLAETLMRYPNLQRSLTHHDPVLSLLQWAAEPADPAVYGRYLIAEPPDGGSATHVLMVQGIVDSYILPSIANATSLSIGLDLAGPELDRDHPELTDFRPLTDLLGFVGRGQIALPSALNVPANGTEQAVTAVVVQHTQDAIEDGHEVIYQTLPPQHQYRCFLQSLASGIPRVPVAAETVESPCQ